MLSHSEFEGLITSIDSIPNNIGLNLTMITTQINRYVNDYINANESFKFLVGDRKHLYIEWAIKTRMLRKLVKYLMKLKRYSSYKHELHSRLNTVKEIYNIWVNHYIKCGGEDINLRAFSSEVDIPETDLVMNHEFD